MHSSRLAFSSVQTQQGLMELALMLQELRKAAYLRLRGSRGSFHVLAHVDSCRGRGYWHYSHRKSMSVTRVLALVPDCPEPIAKVKCFVVEFVACLAIPTWRSHARCLPPH